MCGKLPSSYGNHGHNHITLLSTKPRKSPFKQDFIIHNTLILLED